MQEIAPTTLEGVNQIVKKLATTVRQDNDEFYIQFEDAQDDRALLRAQVSILRRKRRYFRSMASSYEREAAIARQAWSYFESMIQAISVRAAEAGPQDKPAKAGSSC
ncbi:hypothetical protein Tco_1076000 [Tanacetum coccineum]